MKEVIKKTIFLLAMAMAVAGFIGCAEMKNGDDEQVEMKNGDDEQGDDEQGDNEQGDDEQGDDEQGDDEQGDDEQGDDEQGDDEQGDDGQGDDEQGDDEQGDDEQLASLKGTQWKLAGHVDAQGNFKEFAPKDCEDCYTLWFDTDDTATSISISGRWKLDLRKLSPPGTMPNLSLRCELYDKDGEWYCNDLDDFCKSLKIIESYSATEKELKLWRDHSYLLFIPQEGYHLSTIRKGTEWKLSGIVDLQTGELKTLEPVDCEKCYKIHFTGNDLVYVHSILANLFLNLSSLEREYIKHPGGGFLDSWGFDEEYDKYDEYEQDTFLFRYAIDHVTSYQFTADELKLFFVYQEKSYYLLFKCIYQ